MPFVVLPFVALPVHFKYSLPAPKRKLESLDLGGNYRYIFTKDIMQKLLNYARLRC